MDATPDDPFIVSALGNRRFTRMQARHSRFTLTSRGIRLATDEVDSAHARLMAAQLPLRAEVVLSHTTAALILGLPLPYRWERTIPAHVSAPRELHRPRRRDLISHSTDLAADDVTEIAGLRMTAPIRTYVDLASLLPLPELVAAGDVLLRDHEISIEELRERAERRSHYAGRTLALEALSWLDGAAASPRESHLRVMLRQFGFPDPEVNGLVTDDAGGFLALGDLVYRRVRVIVEYDGDVHASMTQRAKDAARRARLRAHGWIVVEIVGEDMRHPERIRVRVQSALDDGAARWA